MTSKFENFYLTFAHFLFLRRSFLTILGVHRCCFQDFFKFVLDLVRECLAIVFALKRHTFDCILGYKG